MEIVAVALGVRTVNHADRALEPGIAQGLRRFAITTAQEKAPEMGIVEGRLVASRERSPDSLALCGTIPIGRRCNRAVVCAEADQKRGAAVALANELTDVQLAALPHFGGARVAQM